MKKKENLTDWYFYEKNAINNGYNLVCGIDEAGRGPLAGPVCAAAVILPPEFSSELTGINDSKKLTAKKRKILFEKIKKVAICYSVEFISEKTIDKLNILEATMLCMKNTIESLSIKPSFVLVDGNKVPDIHLPSISIVKGDSLSASIAAASIIAKVTRDEYMIKISEKYPQYSFQKNKGYGTIEHVKAILKFGPCEIHRLTFLKKIIGGFYEQRKG